MIAARIQFLLERAIDKRLVEAQSARREGIVRNLANAVDLSHRLGILHARHADALHALRRIRNKAAHFDEPMSLEAHRQDVDRFCRPWTEGRAASLFHTYIEREQVLSSGHERALFVVAASTFFVFFKPLATIVPRLDPLHWLRSLDRG